MRNRIDGYLDGAVPWEELSPAEQADATRVRRLIAEARDFITAEAPPDLSGPVLSEIRHARHRGHAPGWRAALARMRAYLWTARSFSIRMRPAYVLAAMAVVMLLIIWTYSQRPRFVFRAGPASTATLFVQFRLQAADAMRVQLAGSFTEWQPAYELHEAAPGLWTITVPLPVGVHDYAFVIDGQQWVHDPFAQQVYDGFGGVNSRVALLPPEASEL